MTHRLDYVCERFVLGYKSSELCDLIVNSPFPNSTDYFRTQPKTRLEPFRDQLNDKAP
jgi:hypothetical protein